MHSLLYIYSAYLLFFLNSLDSPIKKKRDRQGFRFRL